MSLSAATLLGSIANWVLVVSLIGGVVSTFVIVQTTNIKEEHWDADRLRSNERIAELSAQGEQQRKDTADANARAAEANQKAESERLERIKLETRLAPRTLDNDSAAKLRSELTSLKGISVDIVQYPSASADVAPLALALRQIFDAAGLNAKVFTPMGLDAVVTGILIRHSDGAPANIQSAAAQIASALNEAGLTAGVWQPFPVNEPISGAYNGPGTAIAELRVLIGAKPAVR